MVDDDIFPTRAAALILADQIGGMDEVGEFRGHSGGGGTGDERDDGSGKVAGWC